jgi:hypothetical protein
MISGTVCAITPSLEPALWHEAHSINDQPPLPISHHGVCDDLGQLLKACPLLEKSKDREFLISCYPIFKSEEPERDGWRWEKWGPYIGTKTPKADYLYDEPEIDMVVVYYIHERRTPASMIALADYLSPK